MTPWHPVTITPKDDGPYLVFMPDRTLDQFSVQHWDEREGAFTNDIGITHWAPLPAPPEELHPAGVRPMKPNDDIHPNRYERAADERNIYERYSAALAKVRELELALANIVALAGDMKLGLVADMAAIARQALAMPQEHDA